MDKIVQLDVTGPHRVFVVFADGLSGELELLARLNGPMLEPLRDPEFFRQVKLDEYGVPTWPNGADLAPDGLYARLKSQPSA